MPFYSDTNVKQTNPAYEGDDDDDDDIDDENEVLDSDNDDERMSFLQAPMKDGSGSSRSSRSGGSGNLNLSKKRIYVLLIASFFVIMVLVGRWIGFIKADYTLTSTLTSSNKTSHVSSVSKKNKAQETTTPPPPLGYNKPKTND